MKIERLYTSVGYRDYLKSLSDSEFCKLEKLPFARTHTLADISINAAKWDCIDRYFDWLIGSLTKEIYGNNESQDWFNKDGSINIKIQLKWMEAEKKVIFYPEKIKDCNNLGIHTKDFYFGRYIISFYDDGKINLSIDESEDIAVKTLEDLAYYTNGELKLKNFEI